MILQKTKNSLLLLLILALGLPTAQLLAEQEVTQQEATQENSSQPDTKQPVEKETKLEEFETPSFGTLCRLYLAGGGYVLKGIGMTLVQLKTDFFAKAINQEPLTPENQAIARETLTKMGVNPDSIALITVAVPGTPAAAFGENAIIINQNEAKLYTPEEMEFIIGHEMTHLQQKHMLKQGLLAIALPFAAHYGLKAWDAAVHKTLSGIKNTFGVAKESRTEAVINKIDAINHWVSTWCVTKGIIAGLAFEAYSRRCEWQADIGSVTQLKNPEAAESAFAKFQEKFKLERAKSPIYEWFVTPEGDNIFANTHPRPSERIAYIREHAATA